MFTHRCSTVYVQTETDFIISIYTNSARVKSVGLINHMYLLTYYKLLTLKFIHSFNQSLIHLLTYHTDISRAILTHLQIPRMTALHQCPQPHPPHLLHRCR